MLPGYIIDEVERARREKADRARQETERARLEIPAYPYHREEADETPAPTSSVITIQVW